jgi:hypothetical protein
MNQKVIKYSEAGLVYLENYYHTFSGENLNFGFHFIKNTVQAGQYIAKSVHLNAMDYENAMMIICFRYAGTINIFSETDLKYKLLNDFAQQINYPPEDLALVQNAIKRNIDKRPPSTPIELVAWDAITYWRTEESLIIHMLLLREETNKLQHTKLTETDFLNNIKQLFIESNYYTDYAKQNYTPQRDKNFSILEKRIEKQEELDRKALKDSLKSETNFSDKETEDLFKIAFRNYVHLVSVADSKAGLLINVNSIIISVVIAFVVSRSEKYPFLSTPSFILLTVSFTTILLSILASRPQRNYFIQNKESKSYQTFFFGSFDLIGNEFSKADWTTYVSELDALLKGGKEHIYEEMYKETFNVRKVLGKKFTYLSIAYFVFVLGLFLSIGAFFIYTYKVQN